MYLIFEELPTFIKTAVDFYSNLITLFFFYSLYRGLRLIQREEEVCIFYEKVNIEGKKWVFKKILFFVHDNDIKMTIFSIVK